MPSSFRYSLPPALLLVGMLPWQGGAAGLPAATSASKPDVSKIFGRIQYVTAFPDYRVEVVSALEDLRVQEVTALPNSAGRWQIVTSLPDFRIQKVKALGDFKIRYVTALPGTR
ncbi:MAG: hypothetical protein EXS00_02810 [Phycisphaerales bacterium]|nr:hypothetical protein [Phycisphaerales bacterium]